MNIDVLSFGRLGHRILEEVGWQDMPVLDDTGKSLVLQKVAASLKEELRQKDEIIRGKEDYIRGLHKEKSELHEKLDKANSRAAVNKLLKCQEIGCSQRRPPLGEGAADTFKQIRDGNLGDESNG